MTETRRLYRSRTDRMIGGVCGGIAEYFGWDPTLVRVGYVVLSMSSVFFPGIVAYLIMMIIIPEKPAGS
ncbi:MAG TPA: PspC domain-containing protein [Acidimicrobiia bacterium]|jgi:phage shock protein C